MALWLITGVGGGLGRALMTASLGRGDSVAGTVLEPGRVGALEALAPGSKGRPVPGRPAQDDATSLAMTSVSARIHLSSSVGITIAKQCRLRSGSEARIERTRITARSMRARRVGVIPLRPGRQSHERRHVQPIAYAASRILAPPSSISTLVIPKDPWSMRSLNKRTRSVGSRAPRM